MPIAAGRLDTIDVVVRCKDEMPHTARTLDALSRQTSPSVRVLFIDCDSHDGSREAAAGAGAELFDWTTPYLPGAVLNHAMRRTSSPIVVFVNADAVPLARDALAQLVAPLADDGPRSLAATYGRQLARPDADALTRADYLRAFGDAALPIRFGSFFSMAASAIRREVWEKLPFDEALRYSEDVDWVRRAHALGWRIGYAPGALFEHSHLYDLRAQFKRRRGEGRADAAIFRVGAPSVVADLIRPLAGSVARDARARALSPHGVLTRLAQASGYFMGRFEALRAPPGLFGS